MMRDQRRSIDSGQAELRAARRADAPSYVAVAFFSFFANLLMLTGPIYMLQVSDRVLGSGSVETLVSLTLIAGYLFATMAVLDIARTRVMGRLASRFAARLNRRVLEAALALGRKDGEAPWASKALADVRTFIASPAMTAIFDMPWTPIFLIGIWIFHPLLGLLALIGGGILIVLTVLNQWVSKTPQDNALQAHMAVDRLGLHIQTGAETIRATGQQRALLDRLLDRHRWASDHQIHADDTSGLFGVCTRSFRMALQSGLLGMGAYLVVQEELTPGAMIATSILTGRALAPVEMIIAQWQTVGRAKHGWRSLALLLSEVTPRHPKTPLPTPRSRLDVSDLTVIPPGQSTAALRLVSFSVGPGQAIGVIGASGSGKSTLAKALSGVWPAAGGSIRFDGAPLGHYDDDKLGHYIGCLPQTIHLFPGTIAENISGFQDDADTTLAAAKMAGLHDIILSLPNGYDTQLDGSGGGLSGGQRQRIGIARAIYGDPCLVILDEPNAHLDHDGEVALDQTIRALKAAGKACLIMTHRPSALQNCDAVLVLDQGRCVAFGPRDEILNQVLKTPTGIAPSTRRPA